MHELCTFKPCRVSSSSDQDSEVGVNSQQDQFSTCRGHQSLEKSFSYRWKMTPGINFQILVSIFNVEKWPHGSIFNVEKWPPGHFSTWVNILRYTGSVSELWSFWYAGKNSTSTQSRILGPFRQSSYKIVLQVSLQY